MKDKIFVDSNIFLYAFSDKNKKQQLIASQLILKNIIISTQVINEVSSNMLKKLNCNNNEIIEFIESCYARYTVINFSQKVFIAAAEIRQKYSISYYDSLIVATGISAGANILYSEDMQHNQIIFEKLTIINPFK